MSDLTKPSLLRHPALKVWLSIFVYAIFTGWLIQVVILPHFFPQLHAGNGLLAGRDWVGFHEQAVLHAQQIIAGGWEKFRLRPDGDNAIIGVTSFFYVIFNPKPWALLPINAAMFAFGGTALFCMLKNLDLENSEAAVALLPYLFFPSALLQYGQIHKDVFCTAGVLVILWAWSSLLSKKRRLKEIIPFLVISAVALVMLSVFRPYFMFPFLGFGAFLFFLHFVRLGWQVVKLQISSEKHPYWKALKFNLQSICLLVLLCVPVYLMSTLYFDVTLRDPDTAQHPSKFPRPTFLLKSNEAVRSADTVRIFYEEPEVNVAMGDGDSTSTESAPAAAARAKVAAIRAAAVKAAALEAAAIKAVQECRPILIMRNDAFIENTINRIFLKIAVARAGFTSSGGTTAASNIDKGIDFCKNEDLIRYVPRALQIAFFAPFPSKWLSTEKRNSSAVEIYISAVEMFYCYVAYLGLIYWLVSYKRWSLSLLIPMGFAVGLSLLLGLTVANVGTLYRMRFPFCMLFVGIGMAGLIQMAKLVPSWLERVNNKNDL